MQCKVRYCTRKPIPQPNVLSYPLSFHVMLTVASIRYSIKEKNHVLVSLFILKLLMANFDNKKGYKQPEK